MMLYGELLRAVTFGHDFWSPPVILRCTVNINHDHMCMPAHDLDLNNSNGLRVRRAQGGWYNY
jgi:hypothetical protein